MLWDEWLVSTNICAVQIGVAMRRVVVACLVWLAMAMGASSAVAQEDSPCEVESFVAGVQCIDEAGEVAWRVHHPALWEHGRTFYEEWEQLASEATGERADGRPLLLGDVSLPYDEQRGSVVGPVHISGRVYYGVVHYLLEVDKEVGAVVDRIKFPAVIDELEPDGDGALRVGLEYQDSDYWNHQTEIRYRLDGPAPAQVTWGADQRALNNGAGDAGFFHGFLVSEIRQELWDRGGLEEAISGYHQIAELRWHADVEEIEIVVEQLEEARKRDRTNPFYPLYLALWADALGEEERAAELMEEAVNTERAHWKDLLDLSQALEVLGESDLSDQVFERAAQQAERLGIAAERRQALMGMALTFEEITTEERHRPIQRALDAEDAQDVHRLASRHARLFPNIGFGYMAWEGLAEWMEEQGREDYAQEWRDRADRNRAEGCIMSEGPEQRWALEAERSAWIMGGLLLALPFLLFLLGLRGGRRRRKLEGDGDAQTWRSQWLPRWKWGDVLGLAGLLALMMVVVGPMVAQGDATLKSAMEVEDTIYDDGLAAPSVQESIQGLSDSPAQRELMAIAETEAAALERGEELPRKENICSLLVEAIEEDGQQQRPSTWAMVARLGEQSMGGVLPGWLSTLLELMGVMALSLVVGFLVGRRTTKGGRFMSYILPGGAMRPKVLGDIWLVAFAVALMAYQTGALLEDAQGLGLILTRLHLGDVTDYEPVYLATPALVAMAILVLIHGVSVVMDIRRSSSTD